MVSVFVLGTLKPSTGAADISQLQYERALKQPIEEIKKALGGMADLVKGQEILKLEGMDNVKAAAFELATTNGFAPGDIDKLDHTDLNLQKAAGRMRALELARSEVELSFDPENEADLRQVKKARQRFDEWKEAYPDLAKKGEHYKGIVKRRMDYRLFRKRVLASHELINKASPDEHAIASALETLKAAPPEKSLAKRKIPPDKLEQLANNYNKGRAKLGQRSVDFDVNKRPLFTAQGHRLAGPTLNCVAGILTKF